MSMTVENALAVIVALENQVHKDTKTVAILREARSVIYERAEMIRNNPRRDLTTPTPQGGEGE